MKAQLHKIPLNCNSSFLYKKWNTNFFDKPWHFHEEYEIVLIEKSRGTKFIGDMVSFFEEGDLLLLGPNIPHLFKNDEEYYSNKKGLKAKSLFIHFKHDFLGKEFMEVPEMKLIRELLDKSLFALQIKGELKNIVIQRLYEMESIPQPQRLLLLLDILIKLSESKDLQPILSTRFVPNTTSIRDSKRISIILEYVMENFQEKIYLSEVASMINMCDASFSRFFKHHTRKTFTNYVTEIRISHSCRLLMKGDENISQIGYMCGFENLSNFYRHFKKVTGQVPREYKNRFLKEVANG